MFLISLFVSIAWPCAGLVHDDGALADSDAQEAIFSLGESGVTVSYNVHYDGTAEDFGWIIPIFGDFVSMVDGDAEHFDLLRAWTQPQVDYEEESGDDDGGGCGCTDASLKGGGIDSADLGNGVEIVAEGYTGTYEYTVVETGDADEFLTWVEDNGWALHDTDIPVEAYAEEGGVQFVLIRLNAGEGLGATPEEGRMLPPVDLTYSGDALRFPATMARYGMVETVRTSVYVVGDQRARIASGWTETALGTIVHEPDSSAEAVYDEALTEIGGDQAGYGLVWAGEIEGVWVTRFDTLADQEVHTVDPVFAIDAGMDTAETLIKLGYYDEGGSYGAWLLAPLLGLGTALARRRRR